MLPLQQFIPTRAVTPVGNSPHPYITLAALGCRGDGTRVGRAAQPTSPCPNLHQNHPTVEGTGGGFTPRGPPAVSDGDTHEHNQRTPGWWWGGGRGVPRRAGAGPPGGAFCAALKVARGAARVPVRCAEPAALSCVCVSPLRCHPPQVRSSPA